MTTSAEAYHVPVLLAASVDGLAIKPGGVYVDATFGGGGHSREILRRLGEGGGRLFAFDQDADAETIAAETVREARGAAEFTFVRSNFRYLGNWMRYYGVEQIDGLLADLGVSSHHLDDSERGFSFRFADAPLDMRMNGRAETTAADIVNGYDEETLAGILHLYGELWASRRLASAIVKARSHKRLSTAGELLGAVEGLLDRGHEKKDMARLFQALRIEVNHEADALRELLASAAELLSPGGRLVVIAYHSLEDRMVKNMMRSGNVEGRVQKDFFGRIESRLRPVGSKALTPSAEEQAANPRSRSAKMRVAERVS